jgi:transposase
MARAKQRDLRKEAHWRKQLRRQRRSGMTAREFCRQHGLAESAFYFWRREIERRDRQKQAEPAFVAVVVEAVTPESVIEVKLASSGHVVRLRAGFDAQAFKQLLALLETPAC